MPVVASMKRRKSLAYAEMPALFLMLYRTSVCTPLLLSTDRLVTGTGIPDSGGRGIDRMRRRVVAPDILYQELRAYEVLVALLRMCFRSCLGKKRKNVCRINPFPARHCHADG
jgi:hypothetical protein